MTSLLAIEWDVSPAIFEIFGKEIRWYSIFFACSFLLGNFIILKIFKDEGKNEKDIDSLLIYMVVATVIGARLGHCLFYQPDIYLANPIEILKIWEGGLASHGGAFAILIALYLYVRKKPEYSYIWILDRVVIPISLAAFFIRMGNLMNSEIIGKVTGSDWGFIFMKNRDAGLLPRHPTQIYEALTALVLFVVLFFMWKKQKGKLPEGRIFGLFVIVLFGMRVVWERFKEAQVDFEEGMTLNMGQYLSIPLLLMGIFFFVKSFKKNENISE